MHRRSQGVGVGAQVVPRVERRQSQEHERDLQVAVVLRPYDSAQRQQGHCGQEAQVQQLIAELDRERERAEKAEASAQERRAALDAALKADLPH